MTTQLLRRPVARPAFARRTFAALFALLVLVAAGPVAAEELHREFIEGLRDRGYFDTADYYLDTLEQRPDVDPEFKTLIPYERGITLLQGAQTLTSPEAQEAQLDRAAGLLETFVNSNPDHPLVGEANAERGNILLGKARAKIWESQSPLNKDNKAALQQDARQSVLAARAIFQQALDKYKEVFDQFPTFIPAEEQERLAARRKAEVDYMQAQINLAMCTYEEAQTYDRGSDTFKAKMTQAAGEFEQIHQKYRSMVGGLYARMWQGKCWEEQDDISKALGIYNELLEHGKEKSSSTLRVLQDQVRQFRFICLNHRSRRDYQLVIDEAGAWLSDNSNRRNLRTQVGLGIRWQKALAHEGLAGKMKEEMAPAGDVERQLRAALSEATQIALYEGQYKHVSQHLVQQLKARLNIKSGPPESFDAALGLVDLQWPKIDDFQNEVKEAKQKNLPQAEIANRELVLEGFIRQLADTLEFGIQLAEPKTPQKELNKARMLLSYCYYNLERPLDAGVVAEFVVRQAAPEEAETAQMAAQVAMGAYVMAYNQAIERQEDEEDPDVAFELDQLLRICQDIAQRWPESGLADNSRMTVGRIYTRRGMLAEAAEWFGKVPQGSKQYGQAQLNAGQAFWDAYRNMLNKSDDAPPAEELAEWQQSAQEYLQRGITEVAKETPADASVKDATDLIAAKATMAQILVRQQKYAEAIDILQKAPHAPVEAMQFDGEGSRPALGIQSKAFASLVYRLLLHSYVGTQNIDAALKTMDELERVIGGEGGEEVTRIYVQLGREIQKSLEAAKKTGPPDDFQTMLASFDQFLAALDRKRATMSYGSLQWMGETYRALGSTLEGDPKGKQYFTRAADAYQALLEKAAKDADPPKGLIGVKLRLSIVYGEAGEFEKALEEIEEILKEHPNALEVQINAAELLQSWGASGRTDAPQYYKQAIGGRNGNKDGGIWGWAGIANRLRQQLQRISGDTEGLNRDLQLIYAAERNTDRKESLTAEIEALKAEIEAFKRGAKSDTTGTALKTAEAELEEAEEELAAITDAETATRERMKVQAELEQAKAAKAADPDAEKKRLTNIEKLGTTFRNFVTRNEHAQRTFDRLRAAQQELDKLEDENAGPSAVGAVRDRLQMLRDAVRAPQAELARKDEIIQELRAAEAKADGPREQLLDALYNIYASRRDFAKQQSSSDAKAKELKAAQTEMVNLTRFLRREHIPDDRWKDFNNLYAEVQRELSPQITSDKIETLPVTADVGNELTWPERAASEGTEKVAESSQKSPSEARAEQPADEGMSVVAVGLALLLGVGVAGAAIYFMVVSGKKKPDRRMLYASGSEPNFAGGGGGFDEAPSFGPAFDIGDQPRKSAPRPAGTKRPAPTNSATSAPKKRVPKKPAPAGTAPQPVPKKAAPKPGSAPAPKPNSKPAPAKKPAPQPPQAVRPAAPPPKPVPPKPKPQPPQAQPPKPPGAE